MLRAGARLLDHLLRHDGAWDGRGEHARRVEDWLGQHLVDESGRAITSDENALSLELLPWALRKWQFADKVSQGEHGNPDTPVFIKNYDPEDEAMISRAEIGFNCDLLAEAWEKEKHGRVERRTTTAAALRDQARVLGCKTKRVKIAQSGGRLAYFHKLTGPVAESVVRRALGQH